MDKNPRQPQLKPDILASKALTLTQNVYTASLTEKHTKNFLGIFSWGKGDGAGRAWVPKGCGEQEGCDFKPTQVILQLNNSIF